MPNPIYRTSEVTYNAYQADMSTASSAYLSIEHNGVTRRLSCVTHVAITTAPNVITCKLNGTAISTAGGSASHTGAAIGKYYSFTCPNTTVAAGDVYEIVSDGAGSATVPCTWTLVVDTGSYI